MKTLQSIIRDLDPTIKKFMGKFIEKFGSVSTKDKSKYISCKTGHHIQNSRYYGAFFKCPLSNESIVEKSTRELLGQNPASKRAIFGL